jgi:hypothetical protein
MRFRSSEVIAVGVGGVPIAKSKGREPIAFKVRSKGTRPENPLSLA